MKRLKYSHCIESCMYLNGFVYRCDDISITVDFGRQLTDEEFYGRKGTGCITKCTIGKKAISAEDAVVALMNNEAADIEELKGHLTPEELARLF